MSSQEVASIPISHAGELQGLRLLELPPELVTLLEQQSAPKYVGFGTTGESH
jgi:hypothetical protein